MAVAFRRDPHLVRDVVEEEYGWCADDSDIASKLVSGLGPQELNSRLIRAQRATDVGHRTLAFYLHEMEDRGLHQLLGYSSTVHYAVYRLEMSRSLAYQLLAAGRELLELTRIDREFLEGRLSWSKVILLLRVAVRQTESAWIDRARMVSVRRLEREVQGSEKGKLPRTDGKGLPEVRLTISGSVDVLTHELWETARRALGAELGEVVSDAKMFEILAEAYVKDRLGKPSSESCYQLVVETCPSCRESSVHTDAGPEPVAPERVEMIACDAEVVQLDPEPGPEARKAPAPFDRPTPTSLRRKVLARDGNRCACCSSRWRLMAHHVAFRSNGGKTRAENLVTLCSRCHSLVHEGLLDVKGRPGDWHFVGREGRSIHDPPSRRLDSGQPPIKRRGDTGKRAPGSLASRETPAGPSPSS